MARLKQNTDAAPSALEQARRLTARLGGRPGGKPPDRSERWAYRLYVLANHHPETGEDLKSTDSVRGAQR